MRPLIGIPQCLDDRGRWRPGRRYLYLDHAYARAVAAAGGIALHLPLQGVPLQDSTSSGDDEVVRRLVSGLDGLLLPGGDDLLPESPPPEISFDPAPPEQIAFDRALLAAALTRGIPVLGICYGEQLLAIHFGGSLHHHLPLDLPEASRHDLGVGGGRQEVVVEAGNRVAEAIGGGGEISVNRRHHQAVAEPGRGMRVCARARDGVIEGIEREGEGFCLGVQWHPEDLEEPHAATLFRAFVEAARRRARDRDEGPATG